MKRKLSFAEVDNQAVLELPERRMLALVTVVITNVLNGLHIDVQLQNINVAVQVCAVVNAISTNLALGTTLTCQIKK
jgi:hypothetical protein